jgi:hypothetical protein
VTHSADGQRQGLSDRRYRGLLCRVCLIGDSRIQPSDWRVTFGPVPVTRCGLARRLRSASDDDRLTSPFQCSTPPFHFHFPFLSSHPSRTSGLADQARTASKARQSRSPPRPERTSTWTIVNNGCQRFRQACSKARCPLPAIRIVSYGPSGNIRFYKVFILGLSLWSMATVMASEIFNHTTTTQVIPSVTINIMPL